MGAKKQTSILDMIAEFESRTDIDYTACGPNSLSKDWEILQECVQAAYFVRYSRPRLRLILGNRILEGIRFDQLISRPALDSLQEARQNISLSFALENLVEHFKTKLAMHASFCAKTDLHNLFLLVHGEINSSDRLPGCFQNEIESTYLSMRRALSNLKRAGIENKWPDSCPISVNAPILKGSWTSAQDSVKVLDSSLDLFRVRVKSVRESCVRALALLDSPVAETSGLIGWSERNTRRYYSLYTGLVPSKNVTPGWDECRSVLMTILQGQARIVFKSVDEAERAVGLPRRTLRKFQH